METTPTSVAATQQVQAAKLSAERVAAVTVRTGEAAQEYGEGGEA